MNEVSRKGNGRERRQTGNRWLLPLACVAYFAAGFSFREVSRDDFSTPEWTEELFAAGWPFPFAEEAEPPPEDPVFGKNFDLEKVLAEAMVLEELQMRGEEGKEGAYLPNAGDDSPYSGWAEQRHPNGQAKTVYLFREGRLFAARGWNSSGEPDGTRVDEGRGFVVEAEDPRVGYFYDDGRLIAFDDVDYSGNRVRRHFADGLLSSWYPDGTRREEGRWVDGLREGLWKSWHPEGNPSRRIFYERGMLHGRAIEWHRNGSKKSEIHFTKGQPDGIWYEWHEDGGRSVTGLYSRGKPVGLWEGWHDNGFISFRKGYRRGELHGPCHWWTRDGTPYSGGFFIDGMPAQ